MKRLALVLAAATSLLPGAARAAACSPLNCAREPVLARRTARCSASVPRADRPVTVVDLRTGKTKWMLPAGRDRRQPARAPERPERSSGTTRAAGTRGRSCRLSAQGGSARRRLAGRRARGGSGALSGAATTFAIVVAERAAARHRAARQAVGLRRAPRRQALPDQVPEGGGYQVRLVARRLAAAGGGAAQGSARVGNDLGLAVLAALVAPTAATCSRSTSARTAARWCTSST